MRTYYQIWNPETEEVFFEELSDYNTTKDLRAYLDNKYGRYLAIKVLDKENTEMNIEWN